MPIRLQWIRATLVFCAASLAFLTFPTVAITAETLGSAKTDTWCCQETANFQVWTPRSVDSRKVAETLESRLTGQRLSWCPDAVDASWQPKCVVVVHANLPAYQRSIGNPRDSSVGMATFQVEQGKVTSRRIDLRSDANGWLTDALPHELTHLVLADAFGAQPPARWIDEGLAVLAESPAKQALRAEVLARAVAARATIPARDLLTLEGFPLPTQRDVFYSQCASLAALLIEREGCEQFCEFVRQNRACGPEAALQKVYGIKGTPELETLWQVEIAARRAATQTLDALADDR